MQQLIQYLQFFFGSAICRPLLLFYCFVSLSLEILHPPELSASGIRHLVPHAILAIVFVSEATVDLG